MSGTITIHQDHHICGTFNDAISQNDIYRFALHIGTEISGGRSRQIIIATDNSPLSRKYVGLIIGGLTGAGCQVTSIGVAPYSMLTYATRSLNIANALMITPGEGGEDAIGFRLVLDNKPVPSFALKTMLENCRTESFRAADGNGRCTEIDLFNGYMRWLLHGTRPRKGQLSVVWDVNHGAASEIISSLASTLPGRHVVVNQANGTTARKLNKSGEHISLSNLVISGGFDLGISMNADGTLLQMCDEVGRHIHEQHQLGILSKRNKRQPVAGNGLLASRRKARSDLLKHTLKVIRVLTESNDKVSTHIANLDMDTLTLGKGSVPVAALTAIAGAI